VLAVRVHVLESGSLSADDVRPLLISTEDSVDVDTAWELAHVECLLARRGVRTTSQCVAGATGCDRS
jgi:hypothetical protein